MTRRSMVKMLCYDEVFAVIIGRMGSMCTIWNTATRHLLHRPEVKDQSGKHWGLVSVGLAAG